MAHFRLRDLRESWANPGEPIYLPPPAPVAPPKPKRKPASPAKTAYDAGVKARNEGKPESSCPYTSAEKTKYAGWRMGWTQADREHQQVVAETYKKRPHPAAVPGVWLDASHADPAAILAWKPVDRPGKQRVANAFRKFRSKSGWREGTTRKTSGSRSLSV